jgi:sodium-dependent dicarboxylate transporter 2/3/5
MIFFAAITAMIIIYYLPTPEPFMKGAEAIPLTLKAKAVMAVLVFAVILWITEAIPFSATALLLIVFMHIMGVGDFKKLVQLGFGNSVVLFLMGAMGLSAAMTASGLAHRIMLFMLAKVGRRTDHIVLAFISIGMLVSMWVTDMAVAAMLVPLGMSILKDSGCKPLESNFGRALMIGIVWGALIGGTATPAGCGPNVLAMEYVRKLAHMDVTFAQWMAVGVPGAIAMVPLGWWLLMKVFPPEFKEIPTTTEKIKADLDALGGFTSKEKRTLIVFVIMVFFWLAGPSIASALGFTIPEDFVAMAGFTLLFVPGLRVFDNWKSAAENIDWGGLVLISGGIAAGMMLAETGGARWVAWGLLSGVGGFHPLVKVLAIVALVEGLKIFFSSNSVTGAVVMPLIIMLALDLGINPWVLAGPAGIASSMAFVMVTSSPTNVIPYSSGYFSIKDFATVGIPMTVIGILCVTASVAVFGSLANMGIW